MPMRIQAPPAKPAPLTPALVLTFATGCGWRWATFITRNLYSVIGREFHLSDTQAGAIVTLTQLGYACGLFLIAPWATCWRTGDYHRDLFWSVCRRWLMSIVNSSRRSGRLLLRWDSVGGGADAGTVRGSLGAPEKRGQMVGKS